MHMLHHNIASQAWSYLLLSAPPTPLPICPRERILLLLPHRFISAPPPFKFDWCQGTAHCTHKTCQARLIQPTPTSPTSTSLDGSSCTSSHTMMPLLPNSRLLAKICVWMISISLSPTTSRLCLGMKILFYYSQEQLVTMIENIAVDDAIMAWIDEANDCPPVFPKEDNDVSWDVGTD